MQDKQEIGQKKIFGIGEFFAELWGGAENANKRLLSAIGGVAFGLCAYFLGGCELLFSTYPLGVALLCAADRHILFILAGLIASAFGIGDGTTVFVCTYAVIVIVRIFSSLLLDAFDGNKGEIYEDSARGAARKFRDFWAGLFEESPWLKMSSAAIATFCLSIYSLIGGGFRYYDLFGAFFSLVCAPAAVFVFSGYFDRELKNTALRSVAILAIITALTYSLRNFMLFGVYGGAFIAFFSTLCISRRRGMLAGALSGLCLGLAFNPIYAPLFILEAAAAGVLWNISPIAASTAGCIVGIIWGVYVNGMAALSELLPALLCGAMIFGAAEKLSLIREEPEIIRAKPDERAALEAIIKNEALRENGEALRRLSASFSELAESFYNLSDRLRRPAVLDLRRMCDGVLDRYCPACPRREVCWGAEYSETLEIVNRITSDLHTKARAGIDCVPEYMRTRCPALSQMITEINDSCARLTEEALICDRTGVFAVDYDGISQVLADAVESRTKDYKVDDEVSENVAERLRKLRFGYDGVIAYGGRRKSVAVIGLDATRAKIGVKDLQNEFSDLLGTPVSEPKLIKKGARFDLKVASAPRLSAHQCFCSLTAAESEGKTRICGDSVSEFSGPSDFYYSLVSDGMGAGREAAFTSRICSVFLEKMLCAGNRAETSVKLLNSFLSERDGRARSECSATLDLLELDLHTGDMSVYKSGAAPTYIKRGKNCFKLQAKTVPLGIIDKPDTEKLNFSVEDGDIIIMVSDGVTQNREDCVWLLSMLTGDWDNTEDMAKSIAERARQEGSDDDITVAIVKIEKDQRLI
ncbi:MAG: hypothetical protein E7640_03085 [Ruminococcaceae bacterium]|nr:hypothetical protein [Oscillospiraceae bacterium]